MDIARVIGQLASRVAALERRAYAGSVRTSAILDPGDWTSPTLLNGATNFGAGYAPAGYYRDELGRVFTRGSVKLPDGWESAVIFTYDVGFRPAYTHEFMLLAGGGFEGIPLWASAEVQPNGNLIVHVGGGTVESVPLDVIQFRTE